MFAFIGRLIPAMKVADKVIASLIDRAAECRQAGPWRGIVLEGEAEMGVVILNVFEVRNCFFEYVRGRSAEAHST